MGGPAAAAGRQRFAVEPPRLSPEALAAYAESTGRSTMLHDLVIAIGIPLLLLLAGMLALDHWRDSLPPWLQRLSRRSSLLWNIGFGLIISLSLLRWWLQR